jgi:hypothetical protein
MRETTFFGRWNPIKQQALLLFVVDERIGPHRPTTTGAGALCVGILLLDMPVLVSDQSMWSSLNPNRLCCTFVLSIPHASCQFHARCPLPISHARCQFPAPVANSSRPSLISRPCFCCCIRHVLIGDVQFHGMLPSSLLEESQFLVFRAAACEFGQKTLFLTAWSRSGEVNSFFQTKFLISRGHRPRRHPWPA